MALPLEQTLPQLQTKWKSQIDPVLAQPWNQGLILPNVSLINGTTTVNHLLGRKLQGWNVIRKRASASVYDNQDSNPTPASTLLLVSSAAVVVDLWVF